MASRRKMRYLRAAFALSVLTAMSGTLVSTTGASARPASSPGVSAKQIVVGLTTSLTGAEASSFIGGWQGAQARIDEQNAAGGVNGRKIKLVIADDASSATTAA